MFDSRLETLAGAIGVAMGFFFGLSGFGDPGKGQQLSSNPRVRNFIWVVVGAAGVFFVDWKIISSGTVDPELRGTLVVRYALTAIGTALVVVAFMSFGIVASVDSAARTNPPLRGHAVDLLLEYLSYGFRAYRMRREEVETEGRKAEESPNAMSGMGSALSVLISATARDRVNPDGVVRRQFIDKALAGIEDTVKLFAAGVPNLRLRTNYMARVSSDHIVGTRLLFAPAAPETYGGFLLLRRYRDGPPAEPICIPIAAPAAADTLLPGAPAAAFHGNAEVLTPANLKFRLGVPKDIQEEIKRFFKEAGYVSVLSVPLVWEGEVVGVANVESNHIDLVGRGSDMTRRIGDALAPFCVVLGELVKRAES